jgi:hypothetical protein
MMEGAAGRLDADLRSEEMDYHHSDRFVEEATVRPPYETERRAIVDTHLHPIGPKLTAKMAERGFYDPKQEFPQTNAQDVIGYREFYELDYAMPKQREGGRTTMGVAR